MSYQTVRATAHRPSKIEWEKKSKGGHTPATIKEQTNRMSLPLTYNLNDCFTNAYINSRHFFKDLGLKYKIGALSINGWCEYGGKEWTKEDYAKARQRSGAWDAHAWLEDADGNVYDYSFKWFDEVARIQTKKPLALIGEIRGMRKAELKEKGLEYVEADKETQTAIFMTMYRRCKLTEEYLLSGEATYIGKGDARLLLVKA